MIDVVSVFKGLKACIEVVLCELQSIQSILEITNEQFPIYAGAIYSLQRSINNLSKIYSYGIPIEHELKFQLLNTIHVKLKKFSKILKNFSEWDAKIIQPKCISFEQFLFFLSNQSPSKILNKLEKTFIEIEPLINSQILLENKILGTAIRIKHPILQKAWLMMGENQLNESYMPENILIDNLFDMYKKEKNDYIPEGKKESICKKIGDFVKSLDGLAISPADGNISIIEMNQFKITEENSISVNGLINIDDVINDVVVFNGGIVNSVVNGVIDIDNKINNGEEKEQKEVELVPINSAIPIEFNGPVKINYNGNRTLLEPYCVGYGADFNNINACEFVVGLDLLPNDKYKLFGVDVECIAMDQGFGGTNQCHLRYQVNDNVSVKVFQVNRDQFKDNKYNFSIVPENIVLGDTVKLWIFCPGWSGWSMSLNSVKAVARFVPV